jgi:hypothetical protein
LWRVFYTGGAESLLSLSLPSPVDENPDQNLPSQQFEFFLLLCFSFVASLFSSFRVPTGGQNEERKEAGEEPQHRRKRDEGEARSIEIKKVFVLFSSLKSALRKKREEEAASAINTKPQVK